MRGELRLTRIYALPYKAQIVSRVLEDVLHEREALDVQERAVGLDAVDAQSSVHELALPAGEVAVARERDLDASQSVRRM